MAEGQLLHLEEYRRRSECFVVVGYQPSAGAFGGIGCLLLASQEGGQLVYVGEVRGGLSRDDAIALRWMMDRLIVPNAPINVARKRVRWLTPELVAEISFLGWTDDGKLRHASFKGLREEADEANVLVVDERSVLRSSPN